MILEEIAAWKRKELVRSKATTPAAELRSRAKSMEPLRPVALRADGEIRVIAEFKRATPSKGDLPVKHKPGDVAKMYQQAGASAMSVLTDERFFKGGAADLESARAGCDLPILRKDFIIDEYQVWETRALPADMALFIVRLLDKSQLAEYVHLADELGLATLVETHTDKELDIAIDALDRLGSAADRSAIGINNRDLETFKTDLQTTVRLAPRIPKRRTIVSESGVKSAADLALLKAAGAHAALVGEDLVTAEDPGKRLRELMGKK